MEMSQIMATEPKYVSETRKRLLALKDKLAQNAVKSQFKGWENE